MITENRDTTATSEQKVVVLTRVYDAPRELVYKMWTDPKHVKQWWGPRDFTIPRCELDVRPGGAIRIDMQGPAGTPFAGVFPTTGVFREVVEPERLVFSETAFLEEHGDPAIEGLTTVTFEEENGKTKVTVHSAIVWAKPEAADAVAGMEAGWAEQLDKLAEYLAKT